MDSRYLPQPDVRLTHPEWSKNATIYQLNTRQFTEAGTLRAAAGELPRIKDLGVVIVWLMPIHEIGRVHRKGTLGSPYAVRDYYSVNSDLGTIDDLKYFVATAHALGLYVILDWVPNHTAWDNVLFESHRDWFASNWNGDPTPTPWWDWVDIIDLDYRSPALREYMTTAMKYWVAETDIDGYRCDVAGFVPLDFWNNVRAELDEIKPVFMLAEWETRDLHVEAFDATYAWSWQQAMREIAHGKSDIGSLSVYYAWHERAYQRDCMRMMFVSNHDMNSWEGTDRELYGDALEATVVLSVVGDGIPLLYNGQEAGNERRLEFFERDPITWRAHPIGELYRTMFALKRRNTALWNGHWGALMIKVSNTCPASVLSFVRRNDDDRVFAVFNLSPEPQSVRFPETLGHGAYKDYLRDEPVDIDSDYTLALAPWDYRVFVA